MLKNSRRLPKQLLVFVAVALLVISSAGQAGKIYKWVDANGKTHFGDRTTNDGEDVQEIIIPKTPTVDPSVNTRKQRTERLLDNYAQDRSDKAQMREAAAAAKSERQANCESAKNAQVKYERAGSLYKVDEQGNRVFLSDEERERAITTAQNGILKWCQ